MGMEGRGWDCWRVCKGRGVYLHTPHPRLGTSTVNSWFLSPFKVNGSLRKDSFHLFPLYRLPLCTLRIHHYVSLHSYPYIFLFALHHSISSEPSQRLTGAQEILATTAFRLFWSELSGCDFYIFQRMSKLTSGMEYCLMPTLSKELPTDLLLSCYYGLHKMFLVSV